MPQRWLLWLIRQQRSTRTSWASRAIVEPNNCAAQAVHRRTGLTVRYYGSHKKRHQILSGHPKMGEKGKVLSFFSPSGWKNYWISKCRQNTPTLKGLGWSGTHPEKAVIESTMMTPHVFGGGELKVNTPIQAEPSKTEIQTNFSPHTLWRQVNMQSKV